MHFPPGGIEPEVRELDNVERRVTKPEVQVLVVISLWF